MINSFKILMLSRRYYKGVSLDMFVRGYESNRKEYDLARALKGIFDKPPRGMYLFMTKSRRGSIDHQFYWTSKDAVAAWALREYPSETPLIISGVLEEILTAKLKSMSLGYYLAGITSVPVDRVFIAKKIPHEVGYWFVFLRYFRQAEVDKLLLRGNPL